MASLLPLAPYRQQRLTFPSPSSLDILFSELRDCNRSDVPAYGTPHPDTRKWPHHKLVYAIDGDTERENVMRFWYAADRESQDLYNYFYSKADLGGVKFDTVVRRYIFPREDFAPEDVAAGDLMPTEPSGVFAGDYLLVSREMKPTGTQELDSIYVAEERTYILREALVQMDFDEAFGGPMATFQRLYYAGETVTVGSEEVAIGSVVSDPDSDYWLPQSDGTVREARQLSSNWYAVTTRNLVPSDFAANGRSYQTTIDFLWPAVLDGDLQIDSWDLRAGGSDRFVRPVYKRAAYRGPCAAIIQESWSPDSPTDVEIPTSMLPLPISFATPFINFRDEPSLHAAQEIDVTTGSNHPVYRYTAGGFEFQATEPFTDWPESLLVSDEVRPLRGGYLRTRVTVYQPNIPTLEP